MSLTVDARGLACPEPVVRAKKALQDSSDISVIVDNAAARENVTRMAGKEGCRVTETENPDGTWTLRLTRDTAPSTAQAQSREPAAGPSVYVFGDRRMGSGPDELGDVLVRAFIHTLLETSPAPDTMIFYNSGVFLAQADSPVIDDLKEFAARGVEILVCGTCLNYFKLPAPAAGIVSNMYDIAGRMASSGRLVKP